MFSACNGACWCKGRQKYNKRENKMQHCSLILRCYQMWCRGSIRWFRENKGGPVFPLHSPSCVKSSYCPVIFLGLQIISQLVWAPFNSYICSLFSSSTCSCSQSRFWWQFQTWWQPHMGLLIYVWGIRLEYLSLLQSSVLFLHMESAGKLRKPGECLTGWL